MSRELIRLRIGRLSKSLKQLRLPNEKLRRPTVRKLREVRLPIGDSPFSKTEEKIYQSLFGERKQIERGELNRLGKYRQQLFKRLSTTDGKEYIYDAPFPDVSHPAEKIQNLTGLLNKSKVVLISEYDTKPGLARFLQAKYEHHSLLEGGVGYSSGGRHISAALWAVDKDDPLDFWHGGGCDQFEVGNLLRGKGLMVFGWEEVPKQLGQFLQESSEELTPIMAVLTPNLFKDNEMIDNVVSQLNEPWKANDLPDHEQLEVVGGLLTEFARHNVTRGAIGPGQMLYLTNPKPPPKDIQGS